MRTPRRLGLDPDRASRRTEEEECRQDGSRRMSTAQSARSSSMSRCRSSGLFDRKLSAMSPPSSRTRLRPPPIAPLLLVLLVALSAMVRMADAARITFDNCLPDSKKNEQKPMPLQWVPLYLDAIFDMEKDSHNLMVTTWGNVTGAYRDVELPPAGDPRWIDDGESAGKILREPQPDSPNPRATTLFSKVQFLTYEPYHTVTDFCRDSLVNGSCPLAPTFNTTGLELPYALPSMNLSHDLYSSYAFTTLSVTFIIIYGDEDETNIGCISAPITPDLGGLAWMLTFLPFVTLLFVGFATIFASIFSPWGTMDIFKWSSNHGRDADLLRLVTPGFGDCLQYIQFVALTGGLTLNYPGFYQPVASQVAWSALMFNESFASKAPSWQSVVDGIYVTNSTQGLGRLSQLVGMAEVKDVWAGMMVWLMVIIAGVFVLIELGFVARWLYRFINKIPEEDLRAKNVPFSIGNVIRIVFNYFLFPIITLSTFQLVVASQSPAYAVALAIVTLILIVCFAAWLLRLITKARPRSDLFDDLPTLLLYGPLYNTYTDEAAGFALVTVFLGIVRGIAVGCGQAYGVAQIAILASCEIIQLLTLMYFRPFHRQTSMNAYHSLFSVVRLVTILLMVAFAPSLGVTEGPKGWIGYVILLIHGGVLVFGFFLNALQTLVEVIARMLGAGGDDVTGLTRGGLSKIFGMRQLSRRMSRREHGPSRQSQLSSTGMLDAEQASKQGYVMPGGRIRSESAASIGALLNKQHRASSAMDSIDTHPNPLRNFDSAASSFTPTTPGEASPFSFLPSPTAANRPPPAVTADAVDPYYRPPRRRRETLNEMGGSDAGLRSLADSRRCSQAGPMLAEPAELDASISRGPTPAPAPAAGSHGYPPITPRTDYSTREVDFYYGVRGPALNSVRPGRKLGTGPADPTGPMATAAGWFRNMLSGKTKEKGKGFEVVRSARMPPAMQAGGGLANEPPPEGIPVAMSMLRNGPIESDDDEPSPKKKPCRPADVLRDGDESRDLEAGIDDDDDDDGDDADDTPHIPRKSSKRHSTADHSRTPSFNLISPTSLPRDGFYPEHRQQGSLGGASSTTSRLPFERRGSQKRLSSNSSMEVGDDFAPVDLQNSHEDRPTSYGVVPQRTISRVDPDSRNLNLYGTSAEVVDERNPSSRGSNENETRY